MSLKPSAANRRLDSWKEIALFFGRDERTVKRWEKERGLPVQRIPGGNRGSVFALTEELAAWLAASREISNSESSSEAEVELSQGDASEREDVSTRGTNTAPPDSPASELAVAAQNENRNRRIRLAFVGVIAALVLLAATFTLGAPMWRRVVAAKRIHSIAILPLRNATGDARQDYLSDGMTAELIASLRNLQDLSVAPRDSVIAYKDTTKPPQQVMKELHVDALISGEVTRSNGVAGIKAQMLVSGVPTLGWSGEYQGKLGDLLRIEPDVTSALGRGTRAELVAGGGTAVRQGAANKSAGYEQYLRARYFLDRRDEQGLNKAQLYFGQAIAADPTLAPAFSGLADCDVLELLYGSPIDGEKARATAEEALRLDPTSAEAHTALGGIDAVFFWDWDGAEREFQHALQLDPDYALAHQWYATLGLAPQGRLDEALLEILRAHELDPLSEAMQTDVGFIYYLRCQYDESARAFQQALEIDPNFVPAHYWFAQLNRQLGKYAAAYDDDMKVFHLTGTHSPEEEQGMKAAQDAFRSSGYLGFARAKLNLANARARVPELNYVAGRQHFLLGDYDKALADFSSAADQRDPAMLYVGVDPTFKPLHTNQLFQDTLRRMRLQTN